MFCAVAVQLRWTIRRRVLRCKWIRRSSATTEPVATCSNRTLWDKVWQSICLCDFYAQTHAVFNHSVATSKMCFLQYANLMKHGREDYGINSTCFQWRSQKCELGASLFPFISLHICFLFFSFFLFFYFFPFPLFPLFHPSFPIELGLLKSS